jgi:putative Holliday junction resolvase
VKNLARGTEIARLQGDWVIGRLVGVDYGTRRIGLAICDADQRIASPVETLPASGTRADDADRVARWCLENEAVGIVVGLPRNMDDSEGPQAVLTRRFADELRVRAGLPVELWDERLSSFEADGRMEQAGVPRSRRKGRRDAIAAQVILQSYLDGRRGERSE